MNDKELHIYTCLNQLKKKSVCLDKQVACIITTKDYGILSWGINIVMQCDRNCLDKKNRLCVTQHAEVMAIKGLLSNRRSYYAFLSLFPCTDCQNQLAFFVKEIVVFGKQHKEQVFDNIRLEEEPYKPNLHSH